MQSGQHRGSIGAGADTAMESPLRIPAFQVCARLFIMKGNHPVQLKRLSIQQFEELRSGGYTVLDNFISKDMASAIKAAALAQYRRGRMVEGGRAALGAGLPPDALHMERVTRGDHLMWLSVGKPPADTSPVSQLLVALQELYDDLAQFVRLKRSTGEYQLSVQPAGALGMSRHRDAMPDNGRATRAQSAHAHPTPMSAAAAAAAAVASVGAANGSGSFTAPSAAQAHAGAQGTPGGAVIGAVASGTTLTASALGLVNSSNNSSCGNMAGPASTSGVVAPAAVSAGSNPGASGAARGPLGPVPPALHQLATACESCSSAPGPSSGASSLASPTRHGSNPAATVNGCTAPANGSTGQTAQAGNGLSMSSMLARNLNGMPASASTGALCAAGEARVERGSASPLFAANLATGSNAGACPPGPSSSQQPAPAPGSAASSGQGARRITCIVCCNTDWDREQGGMVRVWPPRRTLGGPGGHGRRSLTGSEAGMSQLSEDRSDTYSLRSHCIGGTGGASVTSSMWAELGAQEHESASVDNFSIADPADQNQERAGLEWVDCGEGEMALDIAPLAGRVVLFLSGAVEHAIGPCNADLASATGWYS